MTTITLTDHDWAALSPAQFRALWKALAPVVRHRARRAAVAARRPSRPRRQTRRELLAELATLDIIDFTQRQRPALAVAPVEPAPPPAACPPHHWIAGPPGPGGRSALRCTRCAATQERHDADDGRSPQALRARAFAGKTARR